MRKLLFIMLILLCCATTLGRNIEEYGGGPHVQNVSIVEYGGGPHVTNVSGATPIVITIF